MVSSGKVENQAGGCDCVKELLLKSLQRGKELQFLLILITLLIVVNRIGVEVILM